MTETKYGVWIKDGCMSGWMRIHDDDPTPWTGTMKEAFMWKREHERSNTYLRYLVAVYQDVTPKIVNEQ